MRVAVIGVGSMGFNHLRVYSELDGVQLVGISDVSAERLENTQIAFSGTRLHRLPQIDRK